ncbi:uncharacterized protein LOC109426140 [Aedes albopictus]|nr:uncharacterized protein LOC109426140 [Aedes albopictus]KXJ71659.1 hypothetical protein RP20_CCG020004 [Aedes albopictus]
MRKRILVMDDDELDGDGKQKPGHQVRNGTPSKELSSFKCVVKRIRLQSRRYKRKFRRANGLGLSKVGLPGVPKSITFYVPELFLTLTGHASVGTEVPSHTLHADWMPLWDWLNSGF